MTETYLGGELSDTPHITIHRDVLLGPTWTCLLSVPELSMEPLKHQAILAPGASFFLGQEIAQDDFSLAFKTLNRGHLDVKIQPDMHQAPLSHLLGDSWEFLPRSRQMGREVWGAWFQVPSWWELDWPFK